MIYVTEKHEPLIYTNGAFLRPMKTIDDNGKEFWVWYVTAFEGENSYNNGEEFYPTEVADSLEKLIISKNNQFAK